LQGYADRELGPHRKSVGADRSWSSGPALVYASGLKAVTIVWVARQFTDEHRATLDWLNSITDEEFQFFGLEIELWRIGSSAPAPKFNIVSKPNDWSRQVTQATQRIEAGDLSDTKKTQLEFWTGFMEFLSGRESKVRATAPRPQHWASFSIGRSGFRLDAYALVRDSGIGVNLIIGGENAKQYFHLLFDDKDTIESAIGVPLQWRELPQYIGKARSTPGGALPTSGSMDDGLSSTVGWRI
jgi:Domain of unknown function (DUF4268)